MQFSVTMLFVATAMLLSGDSLLFGQSGEKKDISATVACTDFDFMFGDWDIVNPKTGPTGITASVQGAPNHCYFTIAEKGPRLGEGLCMFAYANATHDWQQICDSVNGGRAFFTTGVRHGDEISFIVENHRDPPGTTRHRFGFVVLPDGTFREFQEASSDNGNSWPKTEMDFIWKRHK